jgi:hypothetical protein
MELPGDEFMTPTSHGPPVSSTLRAPRLQLTNRHVCERLHSVLTAKKLAVFCCGCVRQEISTQDLMHQHIRGFDETPILATSLGPRCAIAMSTAIIRLPIDHSDPRPSRNVSRTAVSNRGPHIRDYFQKTESTWNGETDFPL